MRLVIKHLTGDFVKLENGELRHHFQFGETGTIKLDEIEDFLVERGLFRSKIIVLQETGMMEFYIPRKHTKIAVMMMREINKHKLLNSEKALSSYYLKGEHNELVALNHHMLRSFMVLLLSIGVAAIFYYFIGLKWFFVLVGIILLCYTLNDYLDKR